MSGSRALPDLRPLYLLLVGVGAIVAHLASEFAAMGADADSILFSTRHIYLGVAAIAGIATLITYSRRLRRQSSSGRDLKRILHLGLRSLPFEANGPRYYVLTAGLQFIFGLGTAIGEGCPFCSHDIVAGLLGALLTVLALAFSARMIDRRLPALVDALARLLPVPSSDGATAQIRPRPQAVEARRAVWCPQLFNRPPPFQLLTAS